MKGGTLVAAHADPDTPLLTPGMVAVGVAGALGGVGVVHLAIAVVNGSLAVEGIEALPTGFIPIASWALPVIVLLGIPAAVLLELVMRRFRLWAAIAAYCTVGAGLGLVVQQLLPVSQIPYYGAAAAVAGKAGIEWYRRRSRVAKL